MSMTGLVRNFLAFLIAPAFFIGFFIVTSASGPALLTVGLALLGLAAIAWPAWDYWHHERHSKHYRNFAELHGWEYLSRSFAYTNRFRGFPFGVGIERHQRDVVKGTLNGVPCATFTHMYRSNDEDAPESYSAFQVTLVEVPVALPRLDVLPENTATRVMSQVGGFDVSTESHEFNRRWRVRTSDRRYAFDLLDPRMVERLTWDDTEGMSFRFDAGAIMMWQHGRHGTEDLAHRLGVLTAVARRIPHHLVRRLTEEGQSMEALTDRGRALTGPDWATQPFALSSGQYTGIGIEPEADLPEPPQPQGPTVLNWNADWDGHWES